MNIFEGQPLNQAELLLVRGAGGTRQLCGQVYNQKIFTSKQIIDQRIKKCNSNR